MDTTTPETPAPTRRWRSIVADSLAGGVLAASVALPLTWRVVAPDRVSAGPVVGTTSTSTAETWPAPSTGRRPQPSAGGDGDDDTSTTGESDATETQSTGVVLIDTVTSSGAAAGTGLVLSADGVVVTNYHVVEGARSVGVTIATSGAEYDVSVVGADPDSDIAVLRLDGASGLDVVALDEDDAALGEAVTAVGNADGQGYLSASSGTVTALEESITTAAEGAVRSEELAGLIETDALVVGGYSGGALLDGDGEVVGITTAASSSTIETESYAVPIADALAIVDRIEAGDESGSVRIGPAAHLGVGVTDGLQVASVEAGSPAQGAGVTTGATLLAVAGTPVGDYASLADVLDDLEPGQEVTVRWRDAAGATHRASLTLGASAVA